MHATTKTILSALALSALTLSLATLCHLVLASHAATSFPAGGAVGAWFGGGAERVLGFWGSVLALSASTTVALIVARLTVAMRHGTATGASSSSTSSAAIFTRLDRRGGFSWPFIYHLSGTVVKCAA